MKSNQYIIQLPALILLISYPFLVHFHVIEHSVVPSLVVSILILFSITIRYWLTAIILSISLGLSLWFLYTGKIESLYYLPPIIINYFIGTLFWNSLRRNKIPLIERYKTLLEGDLAREEKRYARQVTIAWSVVLMCLAVISALLFAFFSHYLWSLFTNFISYGILAMMFVIEYIVRIRRFPHKQHMSFFEFVTKLKAIKLKSVVM